MQLEFRDINNILELTGGQFRGLPVSIRRTNTCQAFQRLLRRFVRQSDYKNFFKILIQTYLMVHDSHVAINTVLSEQLIQPATYSCHTFL
jgi:hypothetical protein